MLSHAFNDTMNFYTWVFNTYIFLRYQVLKLNPADCNSIFFLLLSAMIKTELPL